MSHVSRTFPRCQWCRKRKARRKYCSQSCVMKAYWERVTMDASLLAQRRRSNREAKARSKRR